MSSEVGWDQLGKLSLWQFAYAETYTDDKAIYKRKPLISFADKIIRADEFGLKAGKVITTVGGALLALGVVFTIISLALHSLPTHVSDTLLKIGGGLLTMGLLFLPCGAYFWCHYGNRLHEDQTKSMHEIIDRLCYDLPWAQAQQ